MLVYVYERYANPCKKPIIRYVLSFILSVGLSGFYLWYIQSFNLMEMYLQEEDLIMFGERSKYAPFFSSFFTNAFVLFMQELVLLRERKATIEMENAQLKIQRSEAINQQLKQHIHPHFLFNSLSILKSLIHKNPDVAEEYVIRLSDFLRISISSNEANVVMLKEELKLCEDFVQMQKIRFGDALVVSINIPETTLTTGYVPVFSLQLLLENAIKHNALTANAPLSISIKEDNDWLCVSNNIQKKQSIENSTKSGLANLSQRYKIISGHDIIIRDDENTFCVSIKILNDADSNN